MVIYIIKYCYFVFKLNCPASGFYLCEDENFNDLLEDHVLKSFCTLLVEEMLSFTNNSLLCHEFILKICAWMKWNIVIKIVWDFNTLNCDHFKNCSWNKSNCASFDFNCQ